MQQIDPQAAIFTTTDELLGVFGGASGGGGAAASSGEPGMAGVEVYLDLNNNGQHDAGEPITTTAADDPGTPDVDETGQYAFNDLTRGTYVVREIVPASYRQTFPAGDGSHTVDLGVGGAGDVRDDVHFGNQLAPAEVHGTKWDDLNGNGVRDGTLITGSDPDAVFVIDVSGSTDAHFQGSSVGDMNGDGHDSDILDAELAGFIALNQQLVDIGLGNSADVAIVVFGSNATTLDLDPLAAGNQLTTTPLADADGDGVRDVEQILHTIRRGHQGVGTGTDFKDALIEAARAVFNAGTQPENGNVIFMSDGQDSGDLSQEVSALRAQVNNLRAFGAGSGARLDQLQQIDPQAAIFTTTDELLDVFGGAAGGGGSSASFTEPGLAGVTVYVDLDDNGQLDPGEPSALTSADDPATPGVDETGRYSFTGLAIGTHVVREVVPTGYIQTAPAGGSHVVTVAGGDVVEGLDFGNVEAPGTIRGIKWEDKNGDGIYDSPLVAGAEPDIIFIIDVSGSTETTFLGTPTGDVNGDGWGNDILDAEIAGFLALNQQLIDLGVGDTADIAVIVFGQAAAALDMDPLVGGVQLTAAPTADADANGVRDVEQVLRAIERGHQGVGTGTSFRAALAEAADTLAAIGTVPENGNVILLSDGQDSTNISAELAAVRARARQVRAFGAAAGASLDQLRVIDPAAAIFFTTDELLGVFSGADAQERFEFGLPGVEIYLDLNDNGLLDSGEPVTITASDDPATAVIDEAGTYRFDGLAAGDYVVREVVPASHTQTYPAGDGAHRIFVGPAEIVTGIDFGNAPRGFLVVVIGDNAPPSVTYTENDQTAVTIAHKVGQAAVSFAGDNLQAVEGRRGVTVTGTNIEVFDVEMTDTTIASAFSIAGRGGDNLVTIGRIRSHGPVKQIAAKVADVAEFVDIAGALLKLELHNLLAGARVRVGASADPKHVLSVKINDATDAALESGIGIKDLSASNWFDVNAVAEAIAGPWLAKFTVKGVSGIGLELSGAGAKNGVALGSAKLGDVPGGRWVVNGHGGAISVNSTGPAWSALFTGNVKGLSVKTDASGDFEANSVTSIKVSRNYTNANITLNMPYDPRDTRATALGTFDVKQLVDNVTLRTQANVGKIQGGLFQDSNFLAGVRPGLVGLPTAPGDFDTLARINDIKIKGLRGEATWIRNTNFAASTLAKIAAGYAGASAGGQYGFAARTFGTFSYKGQGGTIKPDADLLLVPGTIEIDNQEPTFSDMILRVV